MAKFKKVVLVTGGCGFIGSNFLNRFVPSRPEWLWINLDSLTYAGNQMSVASLCSRENYKFARVDINEFKSLDAVFEEHNPEWVVHFAAESHVDRSIHGPKQFLQTNVMGTLNLLECCRARWQGSDECVFQHVSTDEVYGSLGREGLFTESTAYDPSSPYSASKAASDHLVRAYHRTYGLPVRITNCSNNYGPRQFPEKLIPLMILNCLERKRLPVYGDGSNIRDWLYVDDHCDAILTVLLRGVDGETYNIGGNNEVTNLDVVKMVCAQVALQTDCSSLDLESLIQFVPDRPGHDWRYAIDATKMLSQLEWKPKDTFTTGLAKTVSWYLGNPEWVEAVKTGAYRDWIEKQYAREVTA